MTTETNNAILTVKNLATHFPLEEGNVVAVDGASFEVPAGKTIGIVGESGCGKSVTARSILGILDDPGHIVSGEILLNGQDILSISDGAMRNLLGRQISCNTKRLQQSFLVSVRH